MEDDIMKTLTVCALFAVLATAAGESALAQRTSALQAGPATATKHLNQCAAATADLRSPQPCESRHEVEGAHYASGLTRQEFECTVSGNCVPTGNAGRV